MIDQLETTELNNDEKLRRITENDKELIAHRLGIEPTIDSIKKELDDESKLISEFNAKYPNLSKDAENALKAVTERYGIDLEGRSTVKISGRLSSFIDELIFGDKHHAESNLQDKPAGVCSPKTNISYVFVDNDNISKRSELYFKHVYLHEALHGIGVRKQDNKGNLNKGIEGALEEGIVDALARIATISESEHQSEIDHMRERIWSGLYQFNVDMFYALAKNVGQKVLIDACFGNKTEELKVELENVYGEGSYDFFTKIGFPIAGLGYAELASNWRICKACLEVKNGNKINEPEFLKGELINKYLKPAMIGKLEKEYTDFYKLFFDAKSEEKENLKNYLKEEYPDEIVDVFVTSRPYGFISNNKEVIEKYVDERLETLLNKTDYK